MVAGIGAILVALVVTGACASSAPQDSRPAPESVSQVGVSVSHGGLGRAEVHNEALALARTVPAPLDSVLLVLPGVYERLGIPEAGADPDQRVFGNPEFKPRRIEGGRLSRYLDCGRGFTAAPRADEYDVTMSVLTRLTPTEGGGTLVETTVQATGKPRAVSGNPVYCPSNGTLEKRVAELVLRAL